MNEIRTRTCRRCRGITIVLVRRGLALLASVTVVACLGVSGVGAGTPKPKPKPAIAGATLDGTRLSLASLRGKPVVINVWSSW
jgi:cytochrome c biogenesis protein CcmG, thiol:disulfide interchange protein DsbE